MIKKEQIETIYHSKFMKLYDLQYEEGKHYYCASRRELEDMPAIIETEAYKKYISDAVSCFVVLNIKNEEPKLLLSWEYRYPAGQYVISVPAGLIDPEDLGREDVYEYTAIRELFEETGIKLCDQDVVKVVNPGVFSTPGFTDELNALVYISVNRDEMPALSQSGAEGSEKFDGFKLLTKADARKLLEDGRDENGVYYPLYTWAALMYFLSL